MPTKKQLLDFMKTNLLSELESGREGRNELYDNKNLMIAYRNTLYDIQAYPNSPNLESLKIRERIFYEEILFRMGLLLCPRHCNDG